MDTTTDKLLRELKKAKDLDKFLESYHDVVDELSLPEYLSKLLEERGTTRAEVIAAAGISSAYGYQIFSGERSPSRETVLQLGLGLKLNDEEMQQLLAHARKGALYPRDRRDCVILYACHKGMSLQQVNELLFDRDLPMFHS
ncbi:MAG: helix-turn-helix transcriptional regulator [Clostridia bacterium]|nr:helix-turn-helix transcriptional regulator [Clostridia bacterium]